MSTVLVVNSGSSSLKYQLVALPSGEAIASGLIERIGEEVGNARHTDADGTRETETTIPDHDTAMRLVLAVLPPSPPDAIGHRVVHGGDRFSEPTLITDEVCAVVQELSTLAPLHNPANLAGIQASRAAFGDVPQVAVFDTAFHTTIPEHAWRYAVPPEWVTDYGVRRYGFHGTSHRYVGGATARLLGRDPSDCDIIVLHLGNGASVSAIHGGVCVETSMGMTPLEGLVMGTRSGDIDPAVIAHLARHGMSIGDIDDALNTRSGLLGLCGENDMRRVHELAESGDAAARTALDVYCHRIRKYVGAYLAVLGGADAIVFTAGVGENNPDIRARGLSGLERLGIRLDPARNAFNEAIISDDDSPVTVCVVPTDEEHAIAEQTWELVEGLAR
ncbi:acetate/propionate family kinase [Stackebrandtia soli]|uniref:acetate/propionate family kinase n=1 Tax=Stackebrandtia soli TaxID=1892856 RepID=UPI0039EB7BC4